MLLQTSKVKRIDSDIIHISNSQASSHIPSIMLLSHYQANNPTKVDFDCDSTLCLAAAASVLLVLLFLEGAAPEEAHFAYNLDWKFEIDDPRRCWTPSSRSVSFPLVKAIAVNEDVLLCLDEDSGIDLSVFVCV